MYHRLILYCTMEELDHSLHSLVVKRTESENENVASDRDRTRTPDHDSVVGRVLHQRASWPDVNLAIWKLYRIFLIW